MSHPVRGAWIEMVISPNPKYNAESHPVRGAWIEMAHGLRVRVCRSCRTPSGVRGLKFWAVAFAIVAGSSHPVRGAWIEICSITSRGARHMRSHPVRGAWIEIPSGLTSIRVPQCRTPSGVRGLKFECLEYINPSTLSRTPSGVRGLKYQFQDLCRQVAESHPVRGAWIEITV